MCKSLQILLFFSLLVDKTKLISRNYFGAQHADTSTIISICFVLTMCLSGCASLVPATTPLQLEASPAAAIRIDDESVDAGYFTLDYPDGWRVVKNSIAGEPIGFVLAAPDDSDTWIKISENPIPVLEGTLDPNLYERYDRVENGTHIVYFQGRTRLENQAAFDAIFDAVLNSVIFR